MLRRPQCKVHHLLLFLDIASQKNGEDEQKKIGVQGVMPPVQGVMPALELEFAGRRKVENYASDCLVAGRTNTN